MLTFNCASGQLFKALPILLAIGLIAATPKAAVANNLGPGSDQGGKTSGEGPGREEIPANSLKRMSDSALHSIRRQPDRYSVRGVMGQYNLGLLVEALAQLRGPTTRLMDRLQNAPDEAARKKIVKGLLKVHQDRLGENEKRIKETREKLIREKRLGRVPGFGLNLSDPDDPGVQAFHRMVRENLAQRSYVRLLNSINRTRDLTFFGLF